MNASILLVEDDLVEVRRLESALAFLGYSATLAADGDEALARLQTGRFDAVLLDLVLPGLDGMGLLGALKARGIEVPVVVAVTPGGLDSARSALKAGACDFVVKPAGALRLEVALANAVAHGRRAAFAAAPALARAEAKAAAVRADETAGEILAPSNVIRLAPRVETRIESRIEARADGLSDHTSGLARLDARGHVRPLAALEADAIRFAVTHYGGRMSEVARRLGIGRSTLYRKMAEIGLPAEEQTAARVVAAE